MCVVAIAPFIIIYQITPLNYVRHKAHILNYFDIKYLTHKIVSSILWLRVNIEMEYC